MNFLFITPKYVNRGQYYDFYLGLAYVSSYMKYKGYKVFCLNTNHYDTPIEQQISELISEKHIDVICTGGMSFHFNEINTILDAAKKIKPEIITVVGGAIITSDPNLALENMQIDFGIIGEGEETMADLADAICNGRDLNQVKSIAYFDTKHELIITEHRPPISDLDALPIPDYEGFEYGNYLNLLAPSNSVIFSLLDEVRPAYISASRSCPFSCTFCYHPLGQKYRQRSLDTVFREIDYLVKMYNINLLAIMDELFSTDKERMYEFAERIKKYNIIWMISLRVPDVDKTVLKILKESGIFAISYGIESMSDTILKSMKKKTTKIQIENALKLTYDAKIAIQGNILFGDPEETEETVKESIDWWKNHPEYGINLFMIKTIPDSPIYKYAIANGLIKDKLKHIKDKFPIINLTKLSDEKFEQIHGFVSTSIGGIHYENVKVISSKITSTNYLKENIFEIVIECPLCHTISKYKNMRQVTFGVLFHIYCRNCYAHLRLNTKKCYSANYTLYDKIVSDIILAANRYIIKYSFIRFMYYNVIKKLTYSFIKKYY